LIDKNVLIDKLLEEATRLANAWKTQVVAARSSEELQLTAHLGVDVKFATITARMDGWIEILKKVSSKPRVSRTLPKHLTEPLQSSLSALQRAITHSGNGIEWMFTSRSFGVWLTLTDFLIRELGITVDRESALILSAAQQRISDDIGAIQQASSFATLLNEQRTSVETSISKLSDAEDEVTEKLESIETASTSALTIIEEKKTEALETFKELSAEVDESIGDLRIALKDINKAISEGQTAKGHIDVIVGQAKQIFTDANEQLTKATLDLAAAESKRVEASNRLITALRDVQREGLAGSFTQKAGETTSEMTKEQKRFDTALVYLAVVGVFAIVLELVYGSPTTTQDFSFRMFRIFSLAAPGIWIAWLASRRLSVLNRVLTDYEYKSATALAYESYKNEVGQSNNPDLKEQLIVFAIKAFGENPTKYYDLSKGEAASPAESWLDRLPILGKKDVKETAKA
jgi:hypothetical protein